MTIDTTEAVRLAGVAITDAWVKGDIDVNLAALAVTAALPALAEQFAQAVEAACLLEQHSLMGVPCGGCEVAARLIREVATP